MPAEVWAAALAWLEQDPDADTRAELQALVDSQDASALGVLFAERLQFGTAGLRGALGAGPNRMNRVVVAQTAAGIGAYLLSTAAVPRVVIGYDARHKSHVFAKDSAEILHGAGLEALLLPRPLPTPVLAFAVRHLGADAGIMVTASHNPAQDNGYKVYWGDGSQIVPPADQEIMAAIAGIGRVDELPRDDSYLLLGDDVEDAYVSAVASTIEPGPRDLSFVYTPMHGVGRATFARVLDAAGFGPAHTVAEQADPDPDFPTVAFPNPEEPGAMDLAMALAGTVDADLVIAHDPDADRCAVGQRFGDGVRMFSGDEIGALLADDLLNAGVQGTYATSVVSSTLLLKQAAAHGQTARQTLTGFKWIGKVDDLAFGYEEALGYDVAPHVTRDKDGISAALRILAIAARLKKEGRSLDQRLNEIYRKFGVHQTGQLSVRFDHIGDVLAAMTQLRSAPPVVLGGKAITQTADLSEGWMDLPPADALFLQLDDAGRIIARPSGTEPKLKCYIELIVPVTESADIASVRAQTKHDVATLAGELKAYLGL